MVTKMKLKSLLFLIAVIIGASADSFITSENTNPTVTEYFANIFHNNMKVIYNTQYPDTYAVKLESNVIVYGNTHSKYVIAGAMFDESSSALQSILKNQ